ncbi:hypothetical protein PAPYR_3347 [Paratrimastix pyriformis]|uniref:F-box domain-containing protein n=1 Tax=Paratrimastix pyriformis TaxID=342808 RepID=A0ABQ8UQM2_9EUKA|nr:hypothetical protein PAPYR_3347 [Paratrimastix pyriformis]
MVHINDFPDEILAAILSFFTDKFTNVVLLRFVCRRWRDVLRTHLLRIDFSEDSVRSRVTDAIFLHFSAIPSLKEVNLASCSRLTDKSMLKLVECCPELAVVNVDTCKFTAESLGPLIRSSGAFLLELNLAFYGGSDLPGLLELLGQHCPNLRALHLDYAPRLPARALWPVLAGCPALERLSLQGIKFPAAVFQALARPGSCGRQLRSINLACSTLAVDTLPDLIGGCPCLEVLDLHRLQAADGDSLPRLGSLITAPCLETLRSIDLSGCEIPVGFMRALTTRGSRLQALALRRSMFTEGTEECFVNAAFRKTITSLQLCSTLVNTRMLQILTGRVIPGTAHPGDGYPGLTYLVLQWANEPAETIEFLPRGPMRLKYLRLESNAPGFAAHCLALNDLERRGCEVEMRMNMG